MKSATRPLTAALAAALVAVLPGGLAGCSQPTGLLNVATSPAEDRTFEMLKADTSVALDINQVLLGEKYRDLFFEISTDVYEGRVLLTGTVKSQANKQRATELVRQVGRVREVFNELQVTDSYGIGPASNDLWVETKLKAELVAADNVKSINFRWRAVNGTVYLIGAARSQDELDRVVALIRQTDQVRNVVNHAWVRPAQS